MSKKTSTPKSHLSPKSPHVRTVVVLSGRDLKSLRDRLTGISNRFACEPNFNIVDLYGIQKIPHEFTQADAVICTTETRSLRQLFSPRTKFFSFTNPIASIDTAAVARAAADLLIRRGHTNFAFIETNRILERKSSHTRALAFRAHLSKQGFSCRVYTPRLLRNEVTADNIHDLAKFLADLPKPCGVMLFADDRAQAVLNACRQAQLSVPEQIALVGVDNDNLICEATHPTLSSVLPDFEYAGEILADAIVRQLNGEKRIAPVTYGVKAVIERDSTRDMRWGGLLASRIDDYLAHNFADAVSIAAMAKRFNVSRRYAEQRFKEIKGCTIHERLESLRLDRAQHLLKKTTDPISEIAEACGYRTERAFRYAFTAAFGLSPRQFRK